MCVQGKRVLVFGLLAIAAIAAAPAVVRAANTCNGHQAGVGGQRRAASTYSHVLRFGRLVGTFGSA